MWSLHRAKCYFFLFFFLNQHLEPVYRFSHFNCHDMLLYGYFVPVVCYDQGRIIRWYHWNCNMGKWDIQVTRSCNFLKKAGCMKKQCRRDALADKSFWLNVRNHVFHVRAPKKWRCCHDFNSSSTGNENCEAKIKSFSLIFNHITIIVSVKIITIWFSFHNMLQP